MKLFLFVLSRVVVCTCLRRATVWTLYANRTFIKAKKRAVTATATATDAAEPIGIAVADPHKRKSGTKTTPELVQVTTVAGSQISKIKDGIGTAAAFALPEGICYSPIDDSLLITDGDAHVIRRMFPTTPHSRSELHKLLNSLLLETGALPVQPLISIVFNFAVANSTIHPRATTAAVHSRVLSCCRRTKLTASLSADEVETICGVTERDRTSGTRLLDARFVYTYGVCIDPIRPLNLYVGDISTIRYVDNATDTVSLIAGHDTRRFPFADGIGSAAKFNAVYDLLCTRNGERLYATDYHNYRIRSVDVKTQAVTTIAGSGENELRDGVGLECAISTPRKFVFDTSRSVNAESAIYITSAGGIRRLNLITREMTTCPMADQRISRTFDVWAIAIAPGGALIFSCLESHSIYSLDPRTGSISLIAGGGTPIERGGVTDPHSFVDGYGTEPRFHLVYAIALVEHEQCLYIADSGNRRIRRMTLPQSLFSASH